MMLMDLVKNVSNNHINLVLSHGNHVCAVIDGHFSRGHHNVIAAAKDMEN